MLRDVLVLDGGLAVSISTKELGSSALDEACGGASKSVVFWVWSPLSNFPQPTQCGKGDAENGTQDEVPQAHALRREGLLGPRPARVLRVPYGESARAGDVHGAVRPATTRRARRRSSAKWRMRFQEDAGGVLQPCFHAHMHVSPPLSVVDVAFGTFFLA